MIIVKNRELLIPNNERYIGTTYDNDTENRVFQVPRFSQRGVDLANLTFRLDIQYANESYDTVVLDKEVGEAFVILIWRITSATLQVPGTLYIGLRAIDDEATVKWSSFSAAIYAERHLNTPGNYGGSLTEIEQMEQDHQYMKGVVDELKENIDYAHDAEAWAKGTRSGSAVPSTDDTYHNNSKYYSEQASASKNAAANSATAAANSATHAAETVSDTNARFNNAVAAVTVNTEVQDARVGADGTTYTVLKNRLDAEHTQLKSAISDGIIDYNSVNIVALNGSFTNGEANGITYNWLSKTVCEVTGTATGIAINNIYSAFSLPKGMHAGDKLKIVYETDQPIILEVIAYLNGAQSGGVATLFRQSGVYFVPDNCTGFVMRLRSTSGSVANGYITIKAITAFTNHELENLVTEMQSDVSELQSDVSSVINASSMLDTRVSIDGTNIYNMFDLTTVPWNSGKQINSNGSEGDNANASAMGIYVFCQKGSRFWINDGYRFNIATYANPSGSAFQNYRAFGADEYIIDSDCYAKISVVNNDASIAVTADEAKAALGGAVVSQVKSEEYKAEIQSIVAINGVSLESGTINTDGSLADNASRMRSATGIYIKSGTTLINKLGVNINWRSYTDPACTNFYASGEDFITANIEISRDNYYKFVIQKNNYLNGRLSQYFSINNNNIQKNHESRIEELEFTTQPLRGMPVIFPPSAPYSYSGTDITEAIISGSGNLLTQLYSLYDTLENEHPNHITKEVLGLDQSGTFEIRAYTIQQHEAPITKPVILWISGVHASETYTHTATYAFVKELLENHENNDVLGFIWRNCIFKVIPIANPWGLANGASRYNSRGVNLNRNFNADWQYSTDEYNNSGSAPESEAETQAIVNFVKANSGAVFAVNKHDSDADLSSNGRVAYSVDDFRIDTNVLRSVYAQMQMTILKKYTWIVPNRPSVDYTNMFSSLSTASDHGTMDKWFSTVGVHGCLLEVSRPATAGYTADKQQDFLQMNLEVSVNMISAVLEKNQLMASNNTLWYKYTVIDE